MKKCVTVQEARRATALLRSNAGAKCSLHYDCGTDNEVWALDDEHRYRDHNTKEGALEELRNQISVSVCYGMWGVASFIQALASIHTIHVLVLVL